MAEKIGILLLNMGGPDSLNSIRPFLYNLFSDREIIRLGPSFLQRPIAFLIAKTRAKKSAENYRLIGGKSPLTEITLAQAKKLEMAISQALSQKGNNIIIKCDAGMRYWHPRTPDILKQFKKMGIQKLIGLSLYPHYSKATSGSSLNEFKAIASGLNLDFITIDSFETHPLYIEALKETLFETIEQYELKNFHLVYSAHSLPKRFIEEGDPYLDHIKATINALEKITDIKGTLAFQSRSGPVRWLGPQTDERLKELLASNIRHIVCLPISFVSDHIETLYEIDILFKGIVKEGGGELYMTKGLNTRPAFINALKDMSIRAMIQKGWLTIQNKK